METEAFAWNEHFILVAYNTFYDLYTCTYVTEVL